MTHPLLTRRAGALALGLALLTPLPAAAMATLPATTTDPGLEQTIDPNQAQGTGRVVRTEGHLDFGPTYVDGEWRLQMHDDSEVPSVWRNLSDIVVKVVDEAIRPVPDNPNFSFLPAGKNVWVIPQTQLPDIAWLGWNTQQPAAVERLGQGIDVSITHVTGPGKVSVFLQAGNFGAPDELWSSDALPGTIWMERNSHTHANWVFTEPGAYLLDMTFAADLKDGTHVSVSESLRFAVGSATNAEAVFDLASGAAGGVGSAGAGGSDAGAGAGAATGGSAGTGAGAEGGSAAAPDAGGWLGLGGIGVWAWVGIGAGVIVLALGAIVLFQRRQAAGALAGGAPEPSSDGPVTASPAAARSTPAETDFPSERRSADPHPEKSQEDRRLRKSPPIAEKDAARSGHKQPVSRSSEEDQ